MSALDINLLLYIRMLIFTYYSVLHGLKISLTIIIIMIIMFNIMLINRPVLLQK